MYKNIKKNECGEPIEEKELLLIKKRLYADILGPEYKINDDLSQEIPSSKSDGYKISHSLYLYDKHIFGEKYRKKGRNPNPLNLSISKTASVLFNSVNNNVIKNMDEYYEEKKKGISRANIVMLLSTYRSLHDSVYNGHLEYVKQMEQNIYGHHDNGFWANFTAYENVFEKIDGAYSSDFEIITGASAHDCYRISPDKKAVTFNLKNGYVCKEITYTIDQLELIFNRTAFKLIVCLPALIIAEELANINKMQIKNENNDLQEETKEQ